MHEGVISRGNYTPETRQCFLDNFRVENAPGVVKCPIFR